MSDIYRVSIIGGIIALVGISAGLTLTMPPEASADQARVGIVTAIVAPTVLGFLALLRVDAANKKVVDVQLQATQNADKADKLSAQVTDGMQQVALMAAKTALDPLDNPNHYQRIANLLKESIATGVVPETPPAIKAELNDPTTANAATTANVTTNPTA